MLSNQEIDRKTSWFKFKKKIVTNKSS